MNFLKISSLLVLAFILFTAFGVLADYRGSQIEFPHGQRIAMRAEPNPGFRFDHWKGSYTGSENPIYFDMDKRAYLEAVFVPIDKDSAINELQYAQKKLNKVYLDFLEWLR